MVKIDIDDKRLDKERRKIKKEEEKLRREQEKALRTKKQEEKEKENKKAEKNEKKKIKISGGTTKMIILIALGFISLFVLNFFKNALIDYINGAKHETALGKNQLVMVDVIGIDEKSARKIMDESNIHYNIIYIYDAYTSAGNVIKTSENPGSFIDKNLNVKVYICDDSSASKKSNHKIKTQKTPFVRDSIDVVSFNAEDGSFSLEIQNNNDITIKAIKYTIGFRDKNGNPSGEKTYIQNDIPISPGEKFTLKNNIGDPDVYGLVVSSFVCSVE